MPCETWSDVMKQKQKDEARGALHTSCNAPRLQGLCFAASDNVSGGGSQGPTLWTLLQNSRSVMVQGFWWWPWKAAI